MVVSFTGYKWGVDSPVGALDRKVDNKKLKPTSVQEVTSLIFYSNFHVI